MRGALIRTKSRFCDNCNATGLLILINACAAKELALCLVCSRQAAKMLSEGVEKAGKAEIHEVSHQ